MTTMLALETTSEICSVAVGDGDIIVEDSRRASRKHNELILGMVDQLFEASDFNRAGLDVVSFSSGPGSFTGVRIGASVAQGIAFGLGIDVVPVPTSAAMANKIQRCFSELTEFEIHRRSRKGWVYVSRFKILGNQCVCVENDQLVESGQTGSRFRVIGDDEINLDACGIMNYALSNLETRVPPHLALPRYVEGDTPYVALT